MLIHVSVSTGWAPEYVEAEVDFPRWLSLTRYWEKFPPTHVLIAQYLGAGTFSDSSPAAPVLTTQAPAPDHTAPQDNGASLFDMVPQVTAQKPVAYTHQ